MTRPTTALVSAVVAAATVAWLVKVAANYGKISRRGRDRAMRIFEENGRWYALDEATAMWGEGDTAQEAVADLMASLRVLRDDLAPQRGSLASGPRHQLDSLDRAWFSPAVGSVVTPPCRHEDTWFDRTHCAHGWTHTVCAGCDRQWPDCEPDDGVQPPDPRPVTLASGPEGRPVDATRWTVTGAGHESQTRVGDWG